MRRADEDAVAARKVGWIANYNLLFSLLCEVSRRRDQHAMRGRQLTCDDNRRQIESAADGCVKAFADEVDLTIVEMPVGRDGRIA